MLSVNSNDTSKVICPDWVFFSFVSISNLNTCLSDLRDTVDWGKKWLVDFNARKTQLVSIEDQTKLCHHPAPAKIYPPPPTASHHQQKYIHYLQPKYIHQHPPPATESQNLFYKKPIYRNL